MGKSKIRMIPGLSGPEGLLLAIMARAALDLDSCNKRHRESARRYFKSDVYKGDLILLGLDPRLVPDKLEEV